MGMDDSTGLAEGLAELEERRSEIEALRAELNEGTASRRRGTEGTRQAVDKVVRQSGRHPAFQAWRETGRQKGNHNIQCINIQ